MSKHIFDDFQRRYPIWDAVKDSLWVWWKRVDVRGVPMQVLEIVLHLSNDYAQIHGCIEHLFSTNTHVILDFSYWQCFCVMLVFSSILNGEVHFPNWILESVIFLLQWKIMQVPSFPDRSDQTKSVDQFFDQTISHFLSKPKSFQMNTYLDEWHSYSYEIKIF